MCKVYNALDTLTQTTQLVVEYPPVVTVSYDKTTQTLTCIAEGVPDTYTFSPWEHRLDGKLLQTLRQQPTLILSGTLTFEDTGYYVCQVSNGVISAQRGQAFVTPQSPAIFENQSRVFTREEGENISISVPFYTYSDTPEVKVVWNKSGESTVMSSHREETGPVRLMIHGQSVSIKGNVTVLTLTNVTGSDKGSYTLTVANKINGVTQPQQMIFSLLVTLHRTRRPDSPSTTEGIGQTKQQSGIEVAPIAGGAAGAVILILVIVILIIVIRQRSVRIQSTDKGKKPKKQKRNPQNDERVGNEAFSDDRWKQPDAEIAVNELYGSHSGVPDKKGHKTGKNTRSEEQNFDSENDDGRENEAFSDDRWKQPDAEIAVNELYGSYSGEPDKKGADKPALKKPAKTKKPLTKSKAKLKNNYVVSSENDQSSKSGGLNYQQVEFDKAAGKPKFHPQESAVTYADIGFGQENRPGVASENDQANKGRGLNYQQVEFDKKAGKPKIHPQDSPVTYADISILQCQKTDRHPVLTDADHEYGARENEETLHGVADNTANDLYESGQPSQEIPPRGDRPPRPGKKPKQMGKPFPTKKPLPKPFPTDD